MMAGITAVPESIESADRLPPELHGPLRDLILVLADCKRVLGLRYSDRMLGAPSLEAGIAASSMAQDEWGHARLTYALLAEFGDDPKRLEHGRPAAEYRSIDLLDEPFASWTDMVAGVLLVDTALTVQYRALADSRYRPVYNRVQKLLDEEGFHFQYGAGWARRIAATPAARVQLVASLRRRLPGALRWFGRDEAPGARALLDAAIVDAAPAALRGEFLARIGPVLLDAGVAAELDVRAGAEGWEFAGPLDWSGWDDARRRAGGAPEEQLVARARGDRNRALLLD